MGSKGSPKSDPDMVDKCRRELGKADGPLRNVFYDEQDKQLVYISAKGNVQELTAGRLVNLLNDKVQPYVSRKNAEGVAFRTREHFPRGDASLVVESPDECPNARVLEGVSKVALFRKDGSLPERSGYDPETGYWILDAMTGTKDTKPTAARLREAREVLDEVFGEFPYVGPNSYINYIGALLTPLLVSVYPPAYRGCAISGKNPGDGKTELAITAQILYGWEPTTVLCRKSGEENEKTIVAHLREVGGPPITVFDNVKEGFGSSALEGAMTSRWSKVRGLGDGHTTPIKNDSLIMVTGNNVTLAGDMGRRMFWVNLDGHGKQDKRTDFKVGGAKEYVRENRAEILRALYIIVRNGLEHKDEILSTGTDSFSPWRDFIAHALGLAGFSGEFDPISDARMASGDVATLAFLKAVHAEFNGKPWRTKDLAGKLNGGGSEGDLFDTLPDDYKRAAVDGKLQAKTTSMGKWLGNLEGRVIQEHALQKHAVLLHGAVQWYVQVPDPKVTAKTPRPAPDAKPRRTRRTR